MNLEKLNISKNSKVLFIYPHPDDETYFNAGLIQNLVKNNITTRILCLTQGGASSLKEGIKDNELKYVRKKELESVMKFLKVSNYDILDLEDGNLENENSITEIIEKEINSFEPDVIITFEPNGIYGHKDHVVVSRIITDLNKSHKLNLIYSTFPNMYKPSQKNLKLMEGFNGPIEPNVIIKLNFKEIIVKFLCLKKYKSQVSNKRLFQMLFKPYIYEEYYVVKKD